MYKSHATSCGFRGGFFSGGSGSWVGLVRGGEFRFIGYDDLAGAAKLAFTCRRLHCLANSVRHEPSGAIRAKAKHPHELVGANTLFARGHQMKAENPLVERDMAGLHHGPDRDRKGRAARVALEHPRTVRLAVYERGFVHNAAMRADRTIRPVERLKVRAGRFGVGEDREGEVRHG